jgi:hypothetical protein
VILILLPAGIAASQYSHVLRSPNLEAYNEYYDYVVDLCDIGVESFATLAQAMLVDHLRAEYGDGIADLRKTFWSDARGRMLRIAGMPDATTTWESKCHCATSRSFCR